MKIGMVTEFYYPQPGGISEHIRALSRELRMLGNEVTVITSRIQGDVPERDPRVIRVGRSLPLLYNGSLSRVSVDWRLGRKLERILEEERFDLLHIHNPLMPTLPLLALRKAGCPVLGTFHSYYRRDLLASVFRPLLKRQLDRLRARVPVSPAAHRAVSGLFPGDYHVVPNGVDYEFFAETAARGGRHLLGLEKEGLKILFVGAIVKRKGLPHLLDAFARLRAERDDVELLVVGDGPQRARIQRNLPDSIRDAVHFVGFVPRQKLVEYYAAADLFCAPSLGRESFGMVLLEAMASALPVLGFDIEGYRDVVDHGRDGLLVRAGDAGALSEALRYLLDHPEERVRFGLRGQRKASTLSWRVIAGRIDALYREALGLPRIEPVEAQERVAAGAGLR